jgi:ParB family chromosome partitioning protein
MSRKRALGKGLDALIPPGEAPVSTREGILEVSTDSILPNPRQPRRTRNDAELQNLADSIQEHGVLQPLVVLPANADGSHELIAGERRLEAARLAGLTSVPVIVRIADERQQLELALIENLQREDLNPLEAAEGYRQLAEDFGLSHEEIAEQMGKSRTAVSNTLRLLRLSAAVRQALQSGKISEGHARALLSLPTAQAQSGALKVILDRDLSVRQTEELVRQMQGERKKTKKTVSRSPEETDIEDQLRALLGTRVTLKRGRKGGSMTIYFFSDEELNALVDRIKQLPEA